MAGTFVIKNQTEDFFPALFLSDEQILDLMQIAFPIAFHQNPINEKGLLQLYVKQSDMDSGFDFWFSLTDEKEDARHYRGTVYGIEECFICKGCGNWQQDIAFDDWKNDFAIPVKKVYEYLKRIHYFSETDDKKSNKNLTFREWINIYTFQF